MLKGFNLKLYPNENVVILGKSGSGKSVLIKCLVGLNDIDEGEVKVIGRSIPDMERDELDIIRSEVGFLFLLKCFIRFYDCTGEFVISIEKTSRTNEGPK